MTVKYLIEHGIQDPEAKNDVRQGCVLLGESCTARLKNDFIKPVCPGQQIQKPRCIPQRGFWICWGIFESIVKPSKHQFVSYGWCDLSDGPFF